MATGIFCRWIQSQLEIVKARSAAIKGIEAAGGFVSDEFEYRLVPAVEIQPRDERFHVSFVRRWLGDRSVVQINIPAELPQNEHARIVALFPGTAVEIFWHVKPGQKIFSAHRGPIGPIAAGPQFY